MGDLWIYVIKLALFTSIIFFLINIKQGIMDKINKDVNQLYCIVEFTTFVL